MNRSFTTNYCHLSCFTSVSSLEVHRVVLQARTKVYVVFTLTWYNAFHITLIYNDIVKWPLRSVRQFKCK